MKILDLALNAITALAAAVFMAYFAFRNGTGLFTVLPDGIAELFISHEACSMCPLASA